MDIKHIDHIYINYWFPAYKLSILENQVTSKTTPVSHWSIFEGVSNFDQWLTGVVLLVTWISNIDYWKTGNQQINVDLVNILGTCTCLLKTWTFILLRINVNITKLHHRAVITHCTAVFMAALVFSHYCFILAAICHCVIYLYLQ